MKYHRNKILPVAALVFTILFTSQFSFAQIFKKSADKLKPSSEFVPQSAFMGLAAFPQQVANAPDFKLFPREIVTAWGKKELGFDPMLIKEVTLVVQGIDSIQAGPPKWAAVLHFEKMQGLSGNIIEKLTETKVGGKTVFDGTEVGMPSFMVFDESTMVVGDAAYFSEIVTANRQGKLAALIQQNKSEGEFQLFVNLESVRMAISEMMRELDEYELPMAVDNMRQIPDLVNSFEIGVESVEKIEAKLLMHTSNSSDAERVKEIVVDSMAYGKTSLLTMMATEMDMNDPVQAATVAYAKRMCEKYETKFEPELSGADLSIVAHEEILALPVLMGLVGNMSRGSVGFSPKMTPKFQLKQTALAFHNYADVHQSFPTRVIKNEDGNVLFSSRVELLPYIEQNNLYQKLKLDESWDSRHNIEFTSMVVPTFGVSESGASTIRFPVFPGSVWDSEEALSFGDVHDGTSNTIMAIHAPESDAINWADPSPWKISETDPMKDVFGDRDEVTVAMLDGSSHVLKKSKMTNEKLKAMLTIKGGEIVEIE